MNKSHHENSASSTRKSHSLAAAAAMLNVSEKTLRRRIKAGDVAAEKVSIGGGGLAWRVYLESNATDKVANAMDNAVDTQWTNATDVPEVVPEPNWTNFERGSRVLDNATDTQRTNVPEVSIARAGTVLDNATDNTNATVLEPLASSLQPKARDESTVELLALLRERLTAADERERQMSLQIEAANRQAAEATAALREYLKMQAKALPSGETRDQLGEVGTGASTRHDAETSRDVGAESPINAATGKVTSSTRNGLRGEGLREMRATFKKLLGLR